MSHFADISFDIGQKDDIATLFSKVENQSERHVFGKNTLYVIADSSGARLYWIFKRAGLLRNKGKKGVRYQNKVPDTF